MTNKKLKSLKDLGVFVYDDHKIPSNRREFLMSGVMAIGAFALVPPLMSISPSVLADTTTTTLGLSYLSFEGAGGMNIAGGNVMVGMASNQEQEDFGTIDYGDYIQLGLPASMHPSKSGMLNKEYGLVFHSTSGLLAGMNEVLTADLRDCIDGIIICGRTDDDSAANPINAAFQAQKAGATGKLVQLIGNTNSPNGARSPTIATQVKADLRATRVTNFNEGASLLSIGAEAMNTNFIDVTATGGQARVKSFLNSILGLSKINLDTYVNKKLEAQAIASSQEKSKQVFQNFSPSALNPKNDSTKLALIQSAFGGTGTTVNDEEVASIANLITDKIAGVGSITVGGCDYHTSDATAGYTKDKEIGRYIGKCIKLASLKGTSIFIHLYTDGGVGGDVGGTTDDTVTGGGRINWVGDRGASSSQMLIVYKHGHKRSVNGSLILDGKTRQIGHFKKGGGINFSFNSVSNSVDQMWKAVILNYLACMSSEAPDKVASDAITKFKSIFPSETVPTDADSLIK
jgi:hypothetical protein